MNTRKKKRRNKTNFNVNSKCIKSVVQTEVKNYKTILLCATDENVIGIKSKKKKICKDGNGYIFVLCVIYFTTHINFVQWMKSIKWISISLNHEKH